MPKVATDQQTIWVVLTQESGSLTVAGERIDALTPRTIRPEVVRHLDNFPTIATFETAEAAEKAAEEGRAKLARKPGTRQG